MAFRFQPGCCCGGCVVFSDNFNRADSSTIGNDWVEGAEDWSISSNALRVSAANAVLYRSITQTQTSETITFRFRASADGDQIRFYREYTPAMPGLFDDFYEITVGATAYIEYFVNNASVFACDITAPVDTWHTIRLVRCTSAIGGTWVYLNDDFVFHIRSALLIGLTANIGFATGATVTGNIDFDDFAYEDNSGLSEQQRITITGTPTGGTFTLTFGGQTTSALNHNSSAATVTTALLALSNLESWEVFASGGSLPGSAVNVAFGGRYLCGNVPQMTASSSLTGGTDPAITITTIVDSTECPQCSTCPLPFMTPAAEEVTLIISGATSSGTGNCADPDTCGEFESCDSCGELNGTYSLAAVEGCVADVSSPDYLLCQCGCFELDVDIEIASCSLGDRTTETISKIRVFFGWDSTTYPSAPVRLFVQLTSSISGVIEVADIAIGATTNACAGEILGTISVGAGCIANFRLEAA